MGRAWVRSSPTSRSVAARPGASERPDDHPRHHGGVMWSKSDAKDAKRLDRKAERDGRCRAGRIQPDAGGSGHTAVAPSRQGG
jgi:hypothetical protein